jgi:hypothetical protein
MAPPENVVMAFRFAHCLWPDDAKTASQGTLIAWAPMLSPYSIDELYHSLTTLAKAMTRMPALAVWLDELHAARRKDAPPPLFLPAPARGQITGPDDVYRDKLRKDVRRFLRQPDGSIDPERLAEMDAWVDEVGPHEAAFLKRHGIDVEVTQPVRKGGGI